MLPDLVRTPLGFYVLRDDLLLSRTFERAHRLDTDANLAEIWTFADRIPEGGIVIDAGAFIGDHTILYSQIVATGKVYALEPNPLAYQALVLNTSRLTNVETLPVGLSDVEGFSPFQVEANRAGSFISMGTRTIQILTTTLDAHFAHLMRCDFVHLDAEGFEPRILRGAREFIARCRPILLVEVCDRHLRRAGSSEVDLRVLLQDLGYRVSRIPTHTDPALCDVLCLPS